MATYPAPPLPQAFKWRRLHSLMGIWLVIYLIEHLLVNSQAALFLGKDGSGFIKSVNAIHDLPYLPVIEMAFLGLPFFVHIVWGIKYLFTSKINSYGNTGTDPYLPEYSRNRAYTWQRITSWLLIIGILAHVVHMRFLEYPSDAAKGGKHYYMLPVTYDEGLQTLSARVGAKVYDNEEIQGLKREWSQSEVDRTSLLGVQENKQQEEWFKAIESRPLKPGERMVVANDFGTVELFMLRNTFKTPFMVALYTLLVLFASYHAFNGLWTFLITWGVILTNRSQKIMLKVANFLFIVVAFLGLAAIWLSYWVNLKQ